MSQPPDPEFDLEHLFLPAWAKQPASNKYANFAGGEDSPRRGEGGRDDRRPRGPRRDDRGPRPPRRDSDRRGERLRGERRSGPRDRGRDLDRADLGERGPRREQGPPPPDVTVSFIPDAAGVEALAKQIRMTGRAYPLFAIAQLILQKAERFHVKLSVVKRPDGTVAQPLFLCSLDDTLWLSESEVAGHLLRRHFDTFYSSERVAGETPKGTYTFVGQCGMSGTVLGPPNYHGYQDKLRQLHSERFSRMPFDVFKARVKIVKDEAVVKQWLEEQSFKTTWTALNVPEPVTFSTRDEVEKHLRETHLPNLLKSVESHSVSGVDARALPCLPLRNLVRTAVEDQTRFPLNMATLLSQQFSGLGLHFFKVNKTVTHVCVARPNYLDLEASPVSERVRAIIEFINGRGKTTRRQMFDVLAPAPKPAPPPAAEAPPAERATTPDQDALAADLHWLIHEGHVIEFATDGVLETAKKPLPRPEKPRKSAAPQAAQSSAQQAPDSASTATESSAAEAASPVVDPVAAPTTEPVAVDAAAVTSTAS
jgi:hypothetical protein